MFATSTLVTVLSSPLPQPSTNIAQAQTSNKGLAPGARNLLIALGALGMLLGLLLEELVLTRGQADSRYLSLLL